MSPTCLVFTHSRDYMVPEWVCASLEARGARGLRIDLDRYPTALDLQLTEGASAGRSTLAGLPLDAVQGVYLRKLAHPLLPAELPPEVVRAVQREAHHHLRGLFDVLSDEGAVFVNDLDAELRVDGNKPRQLRVARALGLRVPDTLLTNDPAAARAFYGRHSGQVVVKMLTSLNWSMTRGPQLPTRLLAPEDLDHLDGLRTGPMCFQERIEAGEELRVCVVRGQCYAGAQRMTGDVDWRQHGGAWAKGQVAEDTAQQLTALMDRLGLVMGSIDLMVPDDGPPVFLEVNPAGEWGMLQNDLGYDISGAIADALLERP